MDEDDWFAEVNEWRAKQTWVQPGEVPATAGVAVNNAHVFLVQPAPGHPDLPVITFMTGEDAETVADLLDSSVAESGDIQAGADDDGQHRPRREINIAQPAGDCRGGAFPGVATRGCLIVTG